MRLSEEEKKGLQEDFPAKLFVDVMAEQVGEPLELVRDEFENPKNQKDGTYVIERIIQAQDFGGETYCRTQKFVFKKVGSSRCSFSRN